jgi:hypothetical protein
MTDHHARLVYLVGSLYSKATQIRDLLAEMEADGVPGGELMLTHKNDAGETVTLHVHIDGGELTIMPGEPDDDLRLDISDDDIHLE